MTKSEISYILENYIVTTCGRIFNKNSHFRNIKSFEKPTLLATFKNFCKRNKLNMLQKIERRGYDVRQYEFVKTGVKNGRSYGYLRKTSSI